MKEVLKRRVSMLSKNSFSYSFDVSCEDCCSKIAHIEQIVREKDINNNGEIIFINEISCQKCEKNFTIEHGFKLPKD